MLAHDDKGILLESGTNEVEVLQLLLGERVFGINALKVREIMLFDPKGVTEVPERHPAVVGTVLFHEKSIPLIDLVSFLNIKRSDPAKIPKRRVILVCEFNKNLLGFLADDTKSIRRTLWSAIQSPSPLITASNADITGIALIDGEQVIMIDFETLTEKVLGPVSLMLPEDRNELEEEQIRKVRNRIRVIAADDSPIVRKKLDYLLKSSGYHLLEVHKNGDEAFKAVEELYDLAQGQDLELSEFLTVVVTDIEMPMMDGLTLCKRVKELSGNVRVIVVSSMISKEIEKKCAEVKADGAISKADFEKLIARIDQICL